MSVVAIIPARGGSKGIPRKNLQRVAGRTLLEWAVRAGREAQLVHEVFVSTEDDEIVGAASALGVDVIGRPDELATDTASTDAVLLHALDRADEIARGLGAMLPELVVLLQPTVPQRPPGLVDACIRRLRETGADSLLTAYPLHFVWARTDQAPVRWRCTQPRLPRQTIPLVDRRWHEDGAVYVTRAAKLRETGARLSGRIEVYETRRSVDIDTPEDLELVDMIMRRGQMEADLLRGGFGARMVDA